ncbi:MAG TPA: hypothetical protein VFH39_01995 [Candidatus Saccharimonadales bacterium]|nr:hypothetical protein [Candidatus Saccharimonadales bacterium]
MRLKPFTPELYRRRVFSQLWMLALQFVLGMIMNLMGEQHRGTSHVVYVVVLVTHILNAIGLAEGGVYIALKAPGKRNWVAAIVVLTTLTSGILTVRTRNDMWSFVMACGFLASAWLYVMTYIRADRMVRAAQQ